MSNEHKIIIPDIGGATDVDVIEVLINVGDKINIDDSLITLESDKASMDVPSPIAGVITALKLNVGDKVSEGDVVAIATVAGEVKQESSKESKKTTDTVAETKAQAQEIHVPDIGGATDVDVIEVMVSAGDVINENDSLMTLESDKASMDIPAPVSGKIESIAIKVGDKVSEGSLVGIITVQQSSQVSTPSKAESTVAATTTKPAAQQAAPLSSKEQDTDIQASPSVRRLARELGINLQQVRGSGRKSRITKDDVVTFIKQSSGGSGLGLVDAPKVDFSRFGEIDVKPLTKINKLSAGFLHRNWVTIPHVTQFDEADITDMEAFRQEKKAKAAEKGLKLTPIVFIMKAVVAGLKEYPKFNSSLDESGENLIMKKYFHVGVAVDTPNGLVVAVIRDVDKKGIFELAKELGDISKKAREKGLTPAEMSGSCFTISSLGGIGGTAFTPIVNAPDVAILGVSKSQMKPVYQEGEFVPRLMLPLSLSYDHRVVDGADAARFSALLTRVLADIRKLLLF